MYLEPNFPEMADLVVFFFFFLTDSSSFSERKPEPAPEKKQRATLKRNTSIKKEMRPDMEQSLIRKLEKLGVKPVSVAQHSI